MKKLHLKRSIAVAGVAGATTIAALMLPVAASAEVSNPPTGQFPGGLHLTPTSGDGTVTPTFQTDHACPTGTVQGQIDMITPTGPASSFFASLPFDSGLVSAPFPGSFNADMQTLWLISGATGADTFEFAVDCQTQAGQVGVYTDSVFVSFNADGSGWTSSATPPAGATSTTTTVSGPQLVQVGGNATLTATVTPAGAAGSVSFFDNGNSLGAPVQVDNGTALFSTTALTAGAHPITAKFTPSDSTKFGGSTSSAFTVTVTSGNVQGESINVQVPANQGVFTMSVSDTPVELSKAELSADNTTFESTGELGSVTISDGRNQTQDGWSVSGQVGDFTDGTHTIDGNSLGWSPAITTPNAGSDVTAGSAITANANPGLKQGGGLASAAAHKGLGTTVLGADLDLRVPSSTQPGTYQGTLTVTAVDSAS
ncbi:hypothetical protein GCM10023322_26550 [Rugosimonospora acidiphila]|uniref:Bacterial Ig-like domain-containing protein n=1 Tax=Rugosimonospora acidiphila TaxID=556531 RepID=A0ABP9RQH2_9ACTN